MARPKRKRIGVDTFLDITAAEDRDGDEDESDLEVEEQIWKCNDEDDEDAPAHTPLSFEDSEARQSFIDALCDRLTARYVYKSPDEAASSRNQPAAGPSNPPLTVNPSLLSLPSQSHFTPTPPSLELSVTPFRSLSASISQKRKRQEVESSCNDADGFYAWIPHTRVVGSLSGRTPTSKNDFDMLDIPQLYKMDRWEHVHRLRNMAELANLPVVHQDDLRKEKRRYSRALSTRLREYVGPSQWVTICFGEYRGDVGIAMGLRRDEQDDEERDEMEHMLNNMLQHRPAERRRHEQARQLAQLREEERGFIDLLAGVTSNEFDYLEDATLYKRDVFRVVIIPRLPFSKREITEQHRETQDVVRPFADDYHDRRYPPRLFKPEDYPGTVESWENGCRYYEYQGLHFSTEGFMIAQYPRTSLLLATSIPPKLEKQFWQSRHSVLKDIPPPHPSSWSFDEGEEVIWTEPLLPGPTPTRGWSTTFKYLQVIPRGHRPQTAIVFLNVDLPPKPTCDPNVANPRPTVNTAEQRQLREDNERKRRQEEEAINKGEFIAQVRHLLKPHQKDDWVLIMTGKHRGKSGRVLVRHEDVVTVVLPEDHAMAVCHVNAAKRIPSPVETTSHVSVFGERRELVPVPWLGTEVRATRGPHTGCVGRVEMVERVDGRFGKRIMVGFWDELSKTLVFVDHDHLLTANTAKRLKEAQPLSEMQNRLYSVSSFPMLTNREPWIGIRVVITKGQHKGYTGWVRGVNITFEAQNLKKDRHVEGKTVARRRGVQLRIEFETHVAVGTGLIAVDYQCARDVQSSKFLNKAYPVRRGTYYDFNPDLENLPEIVEDLDRLEVPGTPQWPQEHNDALSRDPNVETHWDPFTLVPCPLGTFGPGPSIPWTSQSPPLDRIVPTADLQDDGPLDPPEQVHAEILQEMCLQAFRTVDAETTPRHWILHPRLVGLKVQAAVDDEDIYLEIVQGDFGRCAVKDVDGSRRVIRDMTAVHHARDRIKPSTEKSLMVVIGGDPQHIGKLVRRVYNFYMGSKSEDNHWINAVVIERSSPTTVEHVTPEQLKLDPKTMVARVYENRKRRQEANEYMKDMRKAALAGHKRVAPIRPLLPSVSSSSNGS